jgi:hypothetical protein
MAQAGRPQLSGPLDFPEIDTQSSPPDPCLILRTCPQNAAVPESGGVLPMILALPTLQRGDEISKRGGFGQEAYWNRTDLLPSAGGAPQSWSHRGKLQGGHPMKRLASTSVSSSVKCQGRPGHL